MPIIATRFARPTLKIRPVTVSLKSLRCNIETDEVGADEPYVIATAVDLTKSPPAVECVAYGPSVDVDKGERHVVNGKPFWGLDNVSAQRIEDPDDVIFLLTLIENDDGNPATKRSVLKSTAVASLAASGSFPRAERVRKLLRDLNGAAGIPTGGPNFDDLVETKEFRFTMDEIRKGASGEFFRTITYRGDGGEYEVTCRMAAG